MDPNGQIISISTEVWQKKLAAYMVATGKNLRGALNEEWPLLLRKVIDFTPPFKAGGASGQSDMSVGRAAVAHDIDKTMRPFDPKNIRTPSLRKIVESKDIPAFNAVANRSKNGLMTNARAIAFSPEAHLRRRNARGRVGGSSLNQVVLGSDAALLKAYVTKVQSHVGFAKSGWAAGYNAVAARGDFGAIAAPLPAYVARHGTAGGDVIDDRQNEDHPSITAINRTPWSVRQDEGDRIKSSAYASRAAALVEKVKTVMRLAREQAQFDGKTA